MIDIEGSPTIVRAVEQTPGDRLPRLVAQLASSLGGHEG
jgi:hypothetical protein